MLREWGILVNCRKTVKPLKSCSEGACYWKWRVACLIGIAMLLIGSSMGCSHRHLLRHIWTRVPGQSGRGGLVTADFLESTDTIFAFLQGVDVSDSSARDLTMVGEGRELQEVSS